MSERRPLTDGLKPATPPVDPAVEKQFVFGGKETAEPEPDKPLRPVGRAPTPQRTARWRPRSSRRWIWQRRRIPIQAASRSIG